MCSLSLAPDLDFLGTYWGGIRYGSPWFHRGATHSIVMALLGAAVATWVVRPPRWKSFALAAAAVAASHGLLDAMTDAGLGIASFWPATSHRFFLPFHPIHVVPIGTSVHSKAWAHMVVCEAVAFSPAWVLSLWPGVEPRHTRWRLAACGAALGLLALDAFQLVARSELGTVLGAPCSAATGVAAAGLLVRFPKNRGFLAPALGVLGMALGFALTFGLDFGLGDPIHISENKAVRSDAVQGLLLGAVAFAWLWWLTLPIGAFAGWLLGRWLGEASGDRTKRRVLPNKIGK
jgi:inner membrane protein